MKFKINFYAAHHGHNACDAAAMHIKGEIPRVEWREELMATEPHHIVLAAGRLRNHEGIVMEPIDRHGRQKVDTLAGIRDDFFYFEIQGNRQVACWPQSHSPCLPTVYWVSPHVGRNGKLQVKELQ